MVLRILEEWLIGTWLGFDNQPEANRKFLATQIIASGLALFVMPFWFLFSGKINTEMLAIMAFMSGPLLAAYCVVKFGNLHFGFVISAFSFTGLITTVSVTTGGISSFASIWLLAIPFEAAFSKSRKVILLSFAFACLSAVYLYVGTISGWFAQFSKLQASDGLGIILGPIALALYTAALAVKVQANADTYWEKLVDNQERYRLLAENTADLIVQHDLNGSVVFASPASHILLGIPPKALSGRGYFDLVHVADKPAFMKTLSDVVTRGKAQCVEVRLKDNKRIETDRQNPLNSEIYRWVELRCRPCRDQYNNVSGIVSTAHDISLYKKQSDELQQAHEDLQQLSDAKSRFLANMSHELRTPLNAIIGFSEILEQGVFGSLQNEKQSEYVKLIHESGNHLLQVVTDILDMSKIESGTFDIVPEPFDVSQLIHTCTGILSQQAEQRGVELKAIVPQNLPEAIADPRACRQILINLISNALKFTDKGGRVNVGARVEGQYLAYFIRDTGIGMSNEDLKRIGQPFFQADSSLDRRYEGTGLGVSVVKGLTELHKGRISFESELGEGTCATVFIPLNCEDEDQNIEILEIMPKNQQIAFNDENDEAEKKPTLTEGLWQKTA